MHMAPGSYPSVISQVSEKLAQKMQNDMSHKLTCTSETWLNY